MNSMIIYFLPLSSMRRLLFLGGVVKAIFEELHHASGGRRVGKILICLPLLPQISTFRFDARSFFAHLLFSIGAGVGVDIFRGLTLLWRLH